MTAAALVGTVLDGKFQIEKPLASGAAGDVYEAVHLGLGAPVAVKVLRPGVPETAEIRRKRFMREARVAARIQSDHVVRVFDIVAPERGLTYIVMELLQGETLQERVQRVGALPIAEAVDYVTQAAKPLAEMHDAGIVHRDVKPSNLFLARDKDGNERIKLLDFGVAAFQQPVARGESSLTLAEAVVGTPRFMAPEQVRAAKDVDARADVWALGVTLYVLLAGKPPFDGKTVLAVLNQIEQQEAPPLADARPEVPRELAAVVHRCLTKDPAGRPASARALLELVAPFGRGAAAKVDEGARAADDALDLSLSDDDVEVLRAAPPPRARFAGAAVRVAVAAAIVALGSVAIAAIAAHRPRADADDAQRRALGESAPRAASSVSAPGAPSSGPPTDDRAAPATDRAPDPASTARRSSDAARAPSAPRRPSSRGGARAGATAAPHASFEDDDRIE